MTNNPMLTRIAEHLKEILGLEDSEIGEFLDAFLESLDQACDQLQKQQDTPDFGQIRIITHTITGFAGNMGALELTEAAKALNKSAHASDAAGCIIGAKNILELQKRYHQK